MLNWGLAVKVAKARSACPPPRGPPHQGALQVEGLSVLAQQHDVLLQVIEAAVLVVADALLWAVGKAALPWESALCPGTLGPGGPLPNKVMALSSGHLYTDSEAQAH